jgi:DNA-directed RNA polymerase specialized sigma24 family protein
MAEDSVSVWLERLRAGDLGAAQPLWERYVDRLIRLARGKLPARVRRSQYEEDVALSAFKSFFAAVEAGRLPRLDDRNNLWAVLVTITERKAASLVERERAAKRGGGEVRGDSVAGGMAESADPEPTPAFAAQVAEECGRLLGLLEARDPLLKQIALWKLEMYTNQEIAQLANRSLATVERKLALIRGVWSQAGVS